MSKTKDLTKILSNPPKCPNCRIDMDLKSKPALGVESLTFVCPNCLGEKVVVLTQEVGVD
jgi:predicted RNA-binding Zn-ribbon protein involved in translation (DUF1610 family)